MAEVEAVMESKVVGKPNVIEFPLTADRIGKYMLKIELVPMNGKEEEVTSEKEGLSAGQGIDLSDIIPEDTGIGGIGIRSIYKLVFIKAKVIRQPTTTAYLYEFRDLKGNSYQWQTYRAKPNLEAGKTYTIKATVKKYFNRRGVRIVNLTRGRILS